MKQMIVLALALAMSGATVAAVSAEPLTTMLRRSGLSPEDFDLMGRAAASLYKATPPRTGQDQTWSNPDTASHGTVRLAAMHGNCAVVEHVAYPKGATKAVELRNRICKAADGTWRLEP